MEKVQTERRKKFTTGIWIIPRDSIGRPLGYYMWSAFSGTKELDMEWSTVVLAHTEDEALKLGKEEFKKFTNNKDSSLHEAA